MKLAIQRRCLHVQHMASEWPGPSGGITRGASRLIVIGSSSGGLNALTRVLTGLPGNLPAAILIVQHISPGFASKLPEILGRSTGLAVHQARAKTRVEDGNVYIAPPDQHMIIDPAGILGLHSELKVNFTRPAVDPLFISAAKAFGPQVIAVILTGYGKDGTAGVDMIQRCGGRVIAQDEATSAHFGMPGSAINGGHVDYVLPLEEIAPHIVKLLEQDA